MGEVERLGELDRRELLKRLGAASAALSLPALLAACGGDGGAGAGGGDIEELTWSLSTTPATLDVATGFSSDGMLAMRLGLETLLVTGDDLALKPQLATSWSHPDPLTYVYELRRGVRFWDGTPLTAEDVAWSLGRHADPKVGSQIAGYYGSVESVEATGGHQVTVRLKQPDALFQYVPVFSFVTPKALGERLGRKLGVPGSRVATMGTGPYRIVSFSGEGSLTAERNPRYWGPRPRARRVILRTIEKEQTALLAMRAGDVDGRFEYSPAQAADWDRLPAASTAYAPGLRIVYLSFDVSSPPWDDVHVRRAVAHAADREGYVKAFLGGRARAATAVASPEQWASIATPADIDALYSRLPGYDYDIEAAKRELAQSRHPDGFAATIVYPSENTPVGRALVSLSQALKPLGIDLTVREVTQAAWVAGIYAHENMGLYYMSLSPTYADPANYLALIYPSANAVRNSFNTANFRNATVDRLLHEQAASVDRDVRARALGDILQISGEELPYLPLWWQDTPMAIRSTYDYDGFNSLYYQQAWPEQVQVHA